MVAETASRALPLRPGDPARLGPYTLVGRLGAGGMGVVFLATAPSGTLVAVKMVHAEYADDPHFRDRFRSEVNRARQVPPFCTAEVLDADPDAERPYLVIEYVDGPSLAEVVKAKGPLSPPNLHAVAIGVATALTAIHDAGVVHRDLTPQNVLLALSSPKVIDFGIARALDGTSQLTRGGGQFAGSVAYMAPERFAEQPTPPTPAADVFAWGVVVTYAGTGRTPFGGDSPAAVIGRILTQPPDLDGLADPLRGLVERALARTPADRPTARELLDQLVSGRPDVGPALPETAVTGASTPPRRHNLRGSGGRPAHARPPRYRRWVAGTVAAGAVGAVVAAAVLTAITARLGAGPENLRPAAAPASAREPSPPGGRRTFYEALAGPSNAFQNHNSQNGTCRFAGGMMRAERAQPGNNTCVGSGLSITGQYTASVSLRIESPGSCGAFWFDYADDDGYVLALCEHHFELAYFPGPDRAQPVRRLPLSEPIRVGALTDLRIDVGGQDLTVFRDGTKVGTAHLPAPSEGGPAVLGVTTAADTGKPPYAVSFANFEIRQP